MKSIIYQCWDHIFDRLENLPNIFDFHDSPMCYKLEAGNPKFEKKLVNGIPVGGQHYYEITERKP